MWYACFDFEKRRYKRKRVDFKSKMQNEGGLEMSTTDSQFQKMSNSNKATKLANSKSQYYLLNPSLYGIGIRRECFSKTLFM